MNGILKFFFVLLCAMTATNVVAELQQNEQTTDSYDAEFFQQFNPQTALDIVNQIPGFTLDSGDSVRGFGAGAGNVLIDGNRPTSKRGGIEDALQRIPATQVLKVELIRGSASVGEAAGQSLVANIIRKQTTSSIRWQAEIEIPSNGSVNPSIETTYTGHLDAWETSLKLNVLRETFPREADIERYTASDELLFTEIESRPSTLTDVFISGDARKAIDDKTIQLTGEIGWSNFFTDTRRERFDMRMPDDSPDSITLSARDSTFYVGEFGADYSTPLSDGWEMKLVGLATIYRWWFDTNLDIEQPVGSYASGSRVAFDEKTNELILRGTTTNSSQTHFRPEFGAEIAYNDLDSIINIWSINSAGTETPIPLAVSSTKVAETRGEVFANMQWLPADNLTLLAGLTVEASEIEVSGDASNKQSFIYYKPSISLAYDFSESLQIRTAIRRSVGQLDFSDFASTANLEDDRSTTGNAGLKPDQTTRFNTEFNYTFSQSGSLNVELYHEWKDDVLEFILLPNGDQGLGNAGDARLWGYSLVATVPLGYFIRGAQIKLQADDVSTEFEDPLTASERILTNISKPIVEIDFRQDLPEQKLAWGLGFRGGRTTSYYYLNDIDTYRSKSRFEVFVESSYYDGLTIRLEVNRIPEEVIDRERLFFTPNRAGILSEYELTRRTRGTMVSLSVAGQF